MIQIEIIGCTSAGKSTLIKQIVDASRNQAIPLSTSYDFILNQFGCGWIQNHKLRMSLLNLFTLWACLVSWHQYRALLHFIFNVIRHLPASIGLIGKVKIARIACRNIGIDSILRHSNSVQQIVLADEGILQIAHYLFVHVAIAPNLDELSQFLEVARSPDAVLYLQQPEFVLLERVNRRGHHRIPAHIPMAAEDFIRHAIDLFEHMAQHPKVQSRAIVIAGQNNNNQEIHPQEFHLNDAWAAEALQPILYALRNALSDDSNEQNRRGSLDPSIGESPSNSTQPARSRLLSLEK
jgi:hypothetical protein